MHKQLRLATWKVSGLCSERKQKQIADLLACNSIDIVAVQESWEKEDSKIDVDGYKWFGKPRTSQRSQRGVRGVGFLLRECLVSEVEFITTVAYEESVWMKVRGERGRLALYIGCVYMPIDSTSVAVLDACYERLKEDVHSFREKRKVVLLGDFNARVDKAADDDDVIGKFGEDTCNASGNDSQLVSEPDWTRVRPSLVQKSEIDLMDVQLMVVAGNVIVESTDIGCSDHFLVWMVEKVNADFDGSRNKFCTRRTKGKYKNITLLNSKAGVSVSSTQGKLEVLRRHYEKLGKVSVDDNFEADWKKEVVSTLETCSNLSEVSENDRLNGQLAREEIAQCVKILKNNGGGGGGCEGIVGELLKYGGSGMVCLLEQLFSVIWREELVPRQWREGLIVNLFKNGDKEDPGNYRGITLLRVAGKVFCSNNKLVERLDRGGILHEGQAVFWVNRSCMDNVFTLNESVQRRLRENIHSF